MAKAGGATKSGYGSKGPTKKRRKVSRKPTQRQRGLQAITKKRGKRVSKKR